jgi:hypothetical protein
VVVKYSDTDSIRLIDEYQSIHYKDMVSSASSLTQKYSIVISLKRLRQAPDFKEEVNWEKGFSNYSDLIKK